MKNTIKLYVPTDRYKTLEAQMQAAYKLIERKYNPKVATLHNNGLTDRIENKAEHREYIALLEW